MLWSWRCAFLYFLVYIIGSNRHYLMRKLLVLFLFPLCSIAQTEPAPVPSPAAVSGAPSSGAGSSTDIRNGFLPFKKYPFPDGLTASATGSRIAWAVDQEGRRNIYVAEGPAFTPRKLTDFTMDDGQEITSLQISDDGRWVVLCAVGIMGRTGMMICRQTLVLGRSPLRCR